ncbi:pectate lyase [Leptospira koniambonensis]|uniref:Pectate lyase n=1 Tax=Leptospira koniambonensis TaxID=2484950 RepID=A0A4R9J2R3_9LEPT|nr:pectate lyase [Leptospira koniambonensis]TGL29841.1 pectate lyase [Leptospira koniambonensis]
MASTFRMLVFASFLFLGIFDFGTNIILEQVLDPSAKTINQLEASSCNPTGTYEFFPGTGYYPSGSSEVYPWQTPAGVSFEGFETYTDGTVIETSSNKSLQSHLEVTSGTLVSKHLSNGIYKRAKTEDYNFRMLIQGLYTGSRVKWTDQALEARFYIDSWQESSNSWQGIHLFTRYRTENDLYVASLRSDGTVYFKKKLCGVYTPLANGILKDQAGNPKSFNTKQWYKLTLVAIGNHIDFYVDNVLQLSITDGTFSWGTSGVRTDYANVYLDDLILHDDLSEF